MTKAVGPAGLEDAYRRFFPMIQAKCTRMLGNAEEARDVAQETFVRFWQAQDGLRAPEAAVAWIYRTATHLALDRLRARKQGGDFNDVPAPGCDPEDVSHARRLLHKIYKELAPDELEVAVLLRVDGLNQLEVAGVMEISERTVRRIVQRLDERIAALVRDKEPRP